MAVSFGMNEAMGCTGGEILEKHPSFLSAPVLCGHYPDVASRNINVPNAVHFLS